MRYIQFVRAFTKVFISEVCIVHYSREKGKRIGNGSWALNEI